MVINYIDELTLNVNFFGNNLWCQYFFSIENFWCVGKSELNLVLKVMEVKRDTLFRSEIVFYFANSYFILGLMNRINF